MEALGDWESPVRMGPALPGSKNDSASFLVCYCSLGLGPQRRYITLTSTSVCMSREEYYLFIRSPLAKEGQRKWE